MLKICPKDRIAIYFFYDDQGIADRYVTEFLKGLKTVAQRLLVVVNGELCEDSAGKIASVADEIFYRPNEGYDAWAYKEAFDHIGWDALQKYKEVIYCNATVFGPVYPFTEMFDRMAEKEDLDFWGISFHPDLITKDTLNPWGYIPEHIQHYFVVYRQRFTAAPALKEYWDNLPPIRNYAETVGLHETVFTKHFADMGFKWDTYVRYTEAEEASNYLLMYDALRAVTKYRCPVIKRKMFFIEEKIVLSNTIGERVSALLDYLKTNRLYDTDLIYENIIRTSNQTDFIDSFNCRYVVPENARLTPKKEEDYASRAALLMLLDGSEACRESAEMSLLQVPRGTGIFRWTGGEENSAAFLENLQSIAETYEYICIWNGKTIPEKKFCTSGKSFTQTQTQALIATKPAVCNILDLFDQNRFLGMLVPLYPFTTDYGAFWADRWEGTFEELLTVREKLGLAILIDKNKQPAVPYLSGCWLRSAAIKRFLSDHSVRSVLTGCSVPVLRRIFPLLVQASGFTPGYVTTDQLAGHQFAALTFYAEAFARINRKMAALLREQKGKPEHE